MNYTITCIVIFLFAQRGDGHIIFGPKDTEAVVGTQLVLHCQTDIKDSSSPVEWEFKANKYAPYVTLYKIGLILNGNQGKMQVEANVSSGHYDLVIFSVSNNNAGAYTCLDDDSQQRAEIIVFEQYPSDEFCSLTKPSDIILGTNQCNMEPDQIEISCKLLHQGNLVPHLKCFNGEQVIASNSSTTNGTVTSSVRLRADNLHSPNFNCRVAYENNMASMFNWTRTVSVMSTSELTSVNRAECNHKQANCSTFADFKCSCVWIDDSNNIVANESFLQLETLLDGNYTCVASCSIREIPCRFVAQQIAYTCYAKQSKMEKSKCFALIGLLGVVLILVPPLLVKILLVNRHKQEEKSLRSAIGGSIQDEERKAGVLDVLFMSTEGEPMAFRNAKKTNRQQHLVKA